MKATFVLNKVAEYWHRFFSCAHHERETFQKCAQRQLSFILARLQQQFFQIFRLALRPLTGRLQSTAVTSMASVVTRSPYQVEARGPLRATVCLLTQCLQNNFLSFV